MPWQLVFSANTPTGANTLSLYSAFVHFNDHILGNLRLWGWNHGNLAGFSQFEFYFPLPFLFMSFLGLLMPLQVAFKIGALLPVFALPFCTYLCLRMLRAHFPGAILASAFSLCFIFAESGASMGGNLASLLSGDFCYGYAFCFSWVYLGAMTWWIKGRGGVVAPSLLLMAVGLCHAYALLFCLTAGVFAVTIRSDWQRAAVRLLVLYTLAFLLLGFWVVPFIFSGAHSESLLILRTAGGWQSFLPPLMWPLLLLAPLGLVLSYTIGDFNDRFRATYLVGGLSAAIGLSLLSPFLDAQPMRFAPFAQYTTLIISACGIGVALKNRPTRGLTAIAIIAVALVWPSIQVKSPATWLRLTNAGTEALAIWPDLKNMYRALSKTGGGSRILFENSPLNISTGTERAFESLPLWTGRPTLAGLYVQASPNSPFIHYLQSEVGRCATHALPVYHCGEPNLTKALGHMLLYNIGHFIAVEPAMVKTAEATPGYELFGRFGPYSVFTITSCPQSYVQTPRYHPVAVVTPRPEFIAFQWFRFTDLHTPLVFFTPEQKVPPGLFKEVLNDDGRSPNDVLQMIRNNGLPKSTLEGQAGIKQNITTQGISISGLLPGEPVWISISYDRGWRSASGETIYKASPAFMLVFPKSETLTLVHGPTWPHWLGLALTICGAILGLWIAASPLSLEQPLSRLSDVMGRHPVNRWLFLVLMATIISSAGWLWWLHDDAQSIFERARTHARAGQVAQARSGFRDVLENYDMCAVADHCLYGVAMTYYREHDYTQAVVPLVKMLKEYPESELVPQALYYLANSFKNLGVTQEAARYAEQLLRRYPQSVWAARWAAGNKKPPR